jgi:hypothetical protein
MTTPTPKPINPQALSEAAKAQTAANRYGLLRKSADARLLNQIKQS